jgi:hypothetical protein
VPPDSKTPAHRLDYNDSPLAVSSPSNAIMPLCREQDRRRSLRRRIQNPDYAVKQKTRHASRKRRRPTPPRTSISPTEDGPPLVCEDVPLEHFLSPDSTATGTVDIDLSSWWFAFASTMSRCRWTAPQWSRTCNKCGCVLLDGENASFCCNNGKWITPSLPSLPSNLEQIVQRSPNKKELSSRSRALNNLFCFTALGATKHFQHFDTGAASVAITGRTYHRLFDVTDNRHSLHWFLYDSLDREREGEHFKVPVDWTRAVEKDLNEVNPYVRHLRRFPTTDTERPTRALILSDVSSNGDFAAIFHADNSTSIKPRTVVVWQNNDAEPTFVPIYSRHYEPLQYPLLFPHGSAGWGLSEDDSGRLIDCLPLTQREWYRSRLLTDNRFQTFGRVSCEYMCDMYSRIEEERLSFIRRSKQTFAHDEHLNDDVEQDDGIELPATFMGSRKWASEQTADSLALARTYGPPSLFITMTCNPEWPEIKSRLQHGQRACDSPIVVARAFKNRLQRLLTILRTKMGSVVYMTVSNEFQKRGFPHSHIVLKVRISLSHVCLSHSNHITVATRASRLSHYSTNQSGASEE